MYDSLIVFLAKKYSQQFVHLDGSQTPPKRGKRPNKGLFSAFYWVSFDLTCCLLK